MLFAAGVAAVYAYSSMDATVHRIAPFLVVFSFGAAAIFRGVQELRAGRVLVIHHRASRAERPVTFWTVVLVFRFAPGAALLAALVWRLVNGSAA